MSGGRRALLSQKTLAAVARSAQSGDSTQDEISTLHGTFLLLIACVNVLVLLIIACLMIRSFAELRVVRPGVDGKNVLATAISLPDSRYGPEAISRFSKTLLDKVKALPGVKSAALVNCVPIDGYCGDNGFSIEGRPLPQGQFYNALNRSALPGYWETVGIRLLAGRDFTERDGRGFDATHPQTSALIISESMSRKYWPEGHALGQRVYFGDENS